MPDIRHLIEISTSAHALYPADPTKRGLRQFWAADVEGGEELADHLDFGFFNWKTLYRLNPSASRQEVSARRLS